jgi:holo-[acyl-carrier protein] synthase
MASATASGLGIDAVDLDRFAATIARRPSVLERCFTSDERAAVGSGRAAPQRFAARFAAKEATMKALGVGLGEVAFTEISVENAPSGAPVVSVTGRAAARLRAIGGTSISVSLTHTHTVAMAVAQIVVEAPCSQ